MSVELLEFTLVKKKKKKGIHLGGLFYVVVKNIVSEEVSVYEKQYRGKELLGFVNYKTFETIVHQYIEQLVEPALTMLRKTIGEERSCVPFTCQPSTFRRAQGLGGRIRMQ